MAELTCCSPAAQETCCEAGDKQACCETAAVGGSCGCPASADDAPDIREAVREMDEATRAPLAQWTGCIHEHASSAVVRARKPA